MKIFISQKFRDLTEEEVLKRRQMIISLIKTEFKITRVEIIENYHPEFDKNSVKQLGESIKEMADADLVLVSDLSIRNIENFKHKYADIANIKGSEFEVLMCLSYGIPYKVYSFEHEHNGSAIRVKWL